jgi:hypothetical protein
VILLQSCPEAQCLAMNELLINRCSTVQTLDSGSGHAVEDAVDEHLNLWKYESQVVRMCSDTTASSTSRISEPYIYCWRNHLNEMYSFSPAGDLCFRSCFLIHLLLALDHYRVLRFSCSNDSKKQMEQTKPP